MRLIRDDELIMAIANWQQTLKPSWSPVNDTDTVIYNTLEEVAGLIESQPTAYDVDAVVRELEEKIRFYENRERRQMESRLGMAACHTNGVQQGIKFAISIVKRGGRNEK